MPFEFNDMLCELSGLCGDPGKWVGIQAGHGGHAYNVHATVVYDLRLLSGAGVDHALLFGSAQGVGLVLESLPSACLSVHDDDHGDVLCVRLEPGLHHVLTTLKTPEGARAVIDNEGIGHRGWRMIRRPSGALLEAHGLASGTLQ